MSANYSRVARALILMMPAPLSEKEYSGWFERALTHPAQKTLLACDTTQQACSIALRIKGARADICYFELTGTSHAEILPALMAEAMARGSVRPAQIEGLGVSLGPGTFAGTRVGLAAIRGFALVHNLPIYAVTSLALMALTATQNINQNNDMPLAALIDARRNGVYMQCFSPLHKGVCEAMDEPRICSPEQAATYLTSTPHYLIGTGSSLIVPFLDKKNCDINAYPIYEPAYPNAAFMLEGMEKNHFAICEKPAPLYLRPPDAAKPATSQAVKRA